MYFLSHNIHTFTTELDTNKKDIYHTIHPQIKAPLSFIPQSAESSSLQDIDERLEDFAQYQQPISISIQKKVSNIENISETDAKNYLHDLFQAPQPENTASAKNNVTLIQNQKIQKAQLSERLLSYPTDLIHKDQEEIQDMLSESAKHNPALALKSGKALFAINKDWAQDLLQKIALYNSPLVFDSLESLIEADLPWAQTIIKEAIFSNPAVAAQNIPTLFSIDIKWAKDMCKLIATTKPESLFFATEELEYHGGGKWAQEMSEFISKQDINKALEARIASWKRFY